jgi:hypothetical protein
MIYMPLAGGGPYSTPSHVHSSDICIINLNLSWQQSKLKVQVTEHIARSITSSTITVGDHPMRRWNFAILRGKPMLSQNVHTYYYLSSN